LLAYQIRLSTWWRYGRHHAAPIDPLRNLWVEPARIECYIDMERETFLQQRLAIRIEDGDWDLDTQPLGDHFVVASFRDRFVRGLPWERTKVYEVAMDGVHGGPRRYHGCRTADAVHRRLRDLDQLVDQIRAQGYRTQREVEAAARLAPQPLRRRRRRPPELEEVHVSIGRNGEFIFIDGVHRFSAACVVGVPQIPVTVLARHAAWQAHRDRVAKDARAHPPETFDHPDLQALRPRNGPAR
jgi:hypothetical protein